MSVLPPPNLIKPFIVIAIATNLSFAILFYHCLPILDYVSIYCHYCNSIAILYIHLFHLIFTTFIYCEYCHFTPPNLERFHYLFSTYCDSQSLLLLPLLTISCHLLSDSSEYTLTIFTKFYFDLLAPVIIYFTFRYFTSQNILLPFLVQVYANLCPFPFWLFGLLAPLLDVISLAYF
jgi:hypothetical protein